MLGEGVFQGVNPGEEMVGNLGKGLHFRWELCLIVALQFE